MWEGNLNLVRRVHTALNLVTRWTTEGLSAFAPAPGERADPKGSGHPD